MTPTACPMCGAESWRLAFSYQGPPDDETPFELPVGQTYGRDFWECTRCGHFLSSHELDLSGLYSSAYVDATYGGRLASAYDRIMALPPERSDNVQRVARIVAELGAGGGERTLLDVGSGLGVFPAAIKREGWVCTALDPDPRAVAHLADHVGVDAICADFMELGDLGSFELVTFNKVLEHVPDPVAMLSRAVRFLAPSGAVYVEVPDGESAVRGGPNREEFFIEHLCAFSMASLCLLARTAGFSVDSALRLREPSDKYTLAAFLTRA